MLGPKSIQVTNINREALPFICTHSSKFARERRTSARKRREKQLFGFYTALVEFYIEEFLCGFLPCGFPKENICFLVFLCLFACYYFRDLLVKIYFKISSK